MKRVQEEKSVLEQRLRCLETQLHASKPSQTVSRLPRPATTSNASSSTADARVAVLETELSKVKVELEKTSRALTTAHTEAAKIPKLQTELIASENARIRAEHAAKAAKQQAEDLQEQLQDQTDELNYWRDNAGDKSRDDEALEAALRERDDALRSLQDARSREASLIQRVTAAEEREVELTIQREEALDELHRLQSESKDHPTYATLYCLPLMVY